MRTTKVLGGREGLFTPHPPGHPAMPRAEHPLHRLFYPRSVAIIGASRNPRKFGHIQVANLLRMGYEGRIYPINPRADEISGLRCYPSVLEVPGEIDVAIVTIPAPKVPPVVEECAEKGVRFVVVISSGFREAGPEGERLQEAMLKAVEGTETRIVGPNTTGILNPEARFTTTFMPIEGPVREGPVSFVVQTGLFAGILLIHILTAEHFGIAKVAGLGNKCDLDEVEVLEYLGQDERTRVIAMYIEGVKNGRELMRVAKEVGLDKPIVVLKSGRTEAGTRAALSHTGSVVGRDEVFDAACRQCGMIRARDFEELIDLAKAFAMQPPPRGPRLGVASYSGAGCVLASDECTLQGLELAELSPESLARLEEALPPWARAGHPIDLEPLHEGVGPDAYGLALEVLASDPGVDAIVVNIMALPEGLSGVPFYAGPDDLVRYFSAAREIAPDKPVAICVGGDKGAVEAVVEALEGAGFPTYPSIRRAVRALSALSAYSAARERLASSSWPLVRRPSQACSSNERDYLRSSRSR